MKGARRQERQVTGVKKGRREDDMEGRYGEGQGYELREQEGRKGK